MSAWLSLVPEMPAARPLDLADQVWFTPLLNADHPGTSEMTFTNLYCWADSHPVLLTRFGPTLFLWRGPRATGYLLPPLGAAPAGEAVRRALAWAASLGETAQFGRLPQAVAERLQSAVPELAVLADRDNADYLYRREDLASLTGRKYDGKRNLIKKFTKTIAAEYAPLDAELARECLRLQADWCEARSCSEHPDLDAEDQSIIRTLELWSELPLLGAALRVSGGAAPIAAFTIAERLTADTAVIHFEKGSTLYPGVYQTINQLFCAQALRAFEFVNREQDLGVEGLRQAKLSYNPVRLVEKFVVKMV